MHYVALSRVRNSSTLHICNLNEKKICVSDKVKQEMSRLREKPLQQQQQHFIHSCRSLNIYKYEEELE